MPDGPVIVARARSFLGGERLSFAEANALWRQLKAADELALARSVLERLRRVSDSLMDGPPAAPGIKDELCREEAMLTSKDPELNTATRHDLALQVLADRFDIDDKRLDGNGEILGIAGGIYKRRWNDLGQFKDLRRAADLYRRGAGDDLGSDAYAHINAAFLEDLLAEAGDKPAERRERAKNLRELIVNKLPISNSWWNVASRAEALFGLDRYDEATGVLQQAQKPAPWELQTTARQLAHLAQIREDRPLDVPQVRAFFDALLPGAANAIHSAIAGKVGLALSGGGLRASFFHLGVLAHLAERDVLRHVEVLSCVSGGSIVGACYWLALRRRLLEPPPIQRDDYIRLVHDLITDFETAVAGNLRGEVQPSTLKMIWRFLWGQKGAMDPEATALTLQRLFYLPRWSGPGPIYMHDLVFRPADHDRALTGVESFNPAKHNWLRAHKVPVLILNATTVNTGHAWQFTPTWMGESPWSVHDAADSVRRLQWHWYEPDVGWKMELGRAVAASACVPGVFAPLQIDAQYEDRDIRVSLVDGGVHDNQGSVSLLASSCNVLLVSDACGQLMLEKAPARSLRGLVKYAMRSMDTLMERVRSANFADLDARRRSGLLRCLMFLHMKEGLDADVIRLRFAQDAYELRRAPLSPAGLRKDFQQALAELRTDLDDFTPDESAALMACGYQMASKGFERNLAELGELSEQPVNGDWAFEDMRKEITSVAATTPRRDGLLTALRRGNKVRL